MEQEDSPGTTFRFGHYECDPFCAQLRKSGKKVKLSDQPFRLLAMLLERPGKLVTREELQQGLWPNQPYGEFSDGLNTAVNRLRAALDDNAETPRFIETIPKRGYRFIAGVERQNGEPRKRSRESGEGIQEQERSTATAGMAKRVVAGLAIAAGLFALWWANPLGPPEVTRIERVTTSARIDIPVKPVSAAGRVYYLQRAGSHRNLMQTWTGQGDGHRVAAPMDDLVVMDVSRDGSKLLIASPGGPGGANQLWIMPAEGGAPAALGVEGVTDAAFSPGGDRLAYIQGRSLWIVNAQGGEARRAATLPDGAGWLDWSPDGRRFRFTSGPLLEAASTSLWEISSDGKNLHALLAGWSNPPSECCGSWTPDGRYYIFTSSHSGRPNLWVLREGGSFWRRSPRGPFQLTSGPDTPWGGTPSRDGRNVFFYNGAWRENMQRLDLKTGRFSPFRSGGESMPVSFSRDGKWITYNGSPNGELFRSRADGTQRVELAPASLGASFPRWSPDGKWIAFGGQFMGQLSKVYVAPAAGGEPQPLFQSSADMRDADWSADGRSLVFSSTDAPPPAAGKAARASKSETLPSLFIVDFATRRARKIPGSDGLAMCRWSPDGRTIAATSVSRGPRELKLWDVPAGEWRVIARGEALGISVWSPDSRYLYFQDLAGSGEPLHRYDVQRKLIEPVAEFSQVLGSGVGRCALYGITPDGSPLVGFSRSFYDLFATQLDLP